MTLVAKHVRTWRRLARKAADELGTAGVYLDDGALFSAARHYRVAADLLEKAQAARNLAMGIKDA